MKIVRLEINNSLGIKEFKISPEKITLIQGKNESGKTSILESIERALYNRNRRVDFVRKGEKEATLYVGLDDGTKIDKKVLPDGETRSKVTRDGAILPKPETLLKSLVGEYSFNPIDFLIKDILVIECDGDYWHSLAEVKKRDWRKNMLLRLNAYPTLRFSESQIHNKTQLWQTEILNIYSKIKETFN